MELSLLKQLNYLFNPASVAVIGASNTFGSWGFGIMARILASPGRRVYPVTKKASEVLGVKAYTSITEIPDSVDLAVIAIPASQIPEVMRECVEKGVKAAYITSGGLAENSEQGAKVEDEIVNIAKRGRIRFIGPNSMGHADTFSQFSTLAWVKELKKGSIGFISQSGTYGERIARIGLQTGIGFSKLISSGNEADLHLEDYLEYLAQDENTKIITAYIEGLREGNRFFQLAKEITKKKPIIVIKAGSTERAARAAKSHTAALVGSDTTYNAMFKQSGVIRVEDEYELFDVVTALSSLPLPRGKRVGILTEGGGFGVVATEACERAGLDIPSFTAAIMERLEALLPPRWSHGNPTDMTDTIVGGKPVTFPCLWAIMEDPNVDAAMLLGGLGAAAYFPQLVIDIDKVSPSTRDGFYQLTKHLEGEELKEVDTIDERMKKYHKPLVVIKIMTEDVAEAKIFGLLRERGIPVYPDPRRAAKVLHHLAWYREYLDSSQQG